jgi:Protein of unknown function (DUF3373)
MKRTTVIFLTLCLLALGSWAQNNPGAASNSSSKVQADDPAELRQEIEQLKKTMNSLEERLAAQEKQAQAAKEQAAATEATVTTKELERRVQHTEREQALDRVKVTGDYRFEAHSIWGNVPTHLDGMAMQNLMVKTLFLTSPTSQGGLGQPFDPAMLSMPVSQFVATLNGAVQNNYSQYQYFTNNLTYNQLNQAAQGFKQAGLFNPFMNYLATAPGVLVPGYTNNADILYTNRLRLDLHSQMSDNISVTARLSMYKVFGDSTGVQVFNGQPSTMNIDGTTAGVPNSDILRVERAYFTWDNIGNSKFYLSIGRRPSTYGPPMNYRQDEPRGGTPSGAIIDYQFDGITFGYHLNDKMVWRVCYGLGYSSEFGNGSILQLPQDRLKDTHFLGADLDLWSTEKTLINATIAHAFNVTDGFNGLVVLPVNPLTGDAINAPLVMRYTPSANLGGINLVSLDVTRRQGPMDLYISGNYSGTRPNGETTPFGGLMSDPYETPVARNGYMFLVGARYNFGQDNRTKIGFEFNHGTKYWFNFAQAEDDIIAPKTDTRGQVYEAYFTHRITQRFIFKADVMKYVYDYSGSGWHLGDPKPLNTVSVLGFPTYKDAFMTTASLIARF